MRPPLTTCLLGLTMAALPLAAQTAGHTTAAHHTSAAATHPSSAPAGCATLPQLSPKIPALPAGTPCAKPLYTLTTTPAIRLDYLSPVENPSLRETLGTEPSTFSLNYVDVQTGTGELAAPHMWFTINYTGYLTDGTKFDSSLDHGKPITIQYGEHHVIMGWDTGLDGMRVGGKRRLFIPYQLAYGPTPHGPIPAKSELIFDVELVAVSSTAPEPPASAGPPAGMPGRSMAPAANPGAPATTAPSAHPDSH